MGCSAAQLTMIWRDTHARHDSGLWLLEQSPIWAQKGPSSRPRSHKIQIYSPSLTLSVTMAPIISTYVYNATIWLGYLHVSRSLTTPGSLQLRHRFHGPAQVAPQALLHYEVLFWRYLLFFIDFCHKLSNKSTTVYIYSLLLFIIINTMQLWHVIEGKKQI